MITLVYDANEEIKEFAVDQIEITCEEDGQIQDYLKAFHTFLRAVGFADGTIERALPTYEY